MDMPAREVTQKAPITQWWYSAQYGTNWPFSKWCYNSMFVHWLYLHTFNVFFSEYQVLLLQYQVKGKKSTRKRIQSRTASLTGSSTALVLVLNLTSINAYIISSSLNKQVTWLITSRSSIQSRICMSKQYPSSTIILVQNICQRLETCNNWV